MSWVVLGALQTRQPDGLHQLHTYTILAMRLNIVNYLQAAPYMDHFATCTANSLAS